MSATTTSVSDEKWRPFTCFFSQVGLRIYQHSCTHGKMERDACVPAHGRWWQSSVALDVSSGKDKNALTINEIVQKATQYHRSHFPECISLICDNTAVSQQSSVTTQQCHNTAVSQHNSVTTQNLLFFRTDF